MRKLEKISYRRNAENLTNLSENFYFETDNLIVFVKLIICFYRFYRFYPPFITRSRDYIVEKNDIYFGTSFSTAILIKISILIF
jgi:hypothetical protein